MKDTGRIDAATAREITEQIVGLIDSSTYLEPARAG
jgi:hypothetical protein